MFVMKYVVLFSLVALSGCLAQPKTALQPLEIDDDMVPFFFQTEEEPQRQVAPIEGLVLAFSNRLQQPISRSSASS